MNARNYGKKCFFSWIIRLYWIHTSSSRWFAFISRFFGWLSVPCIPFDTVHSTSEQTIVHARTRCVPWAFGPCTIVCRSGVCTVFPRNRFSIIGSAWWLHRTSGHGNYSNLVEIRFWPINYMKSLIDT